jgi:1,5-anhydro-D-fructose reductase (1,5-anhydro-D-mannitol-forming)
MSGDDAGAGGGGVRWALLGTGRVLRTLILPAFAQVEGSVVEGVAGSSSDRAAEFAREFHIPRTYRDFDELLADRAIDAVYIATPNGLHADQIVRCAAAGKHVLCDKPLATRPEDARRARDAADAAGVALGIMFQSRYFEGIVKLRQLVADGSLGCPVVAHVEISGGSSPLRGWRTDQASAGSGALTNLGVHALDALEYVLGDRVVEVSAMTDAGVSKPLELTSVVALRFRGGVLATANVNQSVAHPRADLTIYGEAGTAAGVSVTRPGLQGEVEVITHAGTQRFPVASRDGFAGALAAFSDSVRTGGATSPSGDDGVHSTDLIHAIICSAAEGRAVTVD